MLALIIVLFAMLIRKKRNDIALEQVVKERTREFELQTVTLTALFDSIPDLVFTKDLNFKYMHCNKSLLEYFGIRREDIIGKGDVDGLKAPIDIAKKHLDMDRMVVNERKAVICEEMIMNHEGVKQLFETIKIPLIVSNVMVGFLGISRNITKRKEMEQAALAASRSKSEFLAVMSHEIRTPMNSIVGFSELALDGDINLKTKNYLLKILENTEGLLQIINDILDISKVETGRMELDKIPFDLHELLESCQAIMTPKADEKSLMLHFYAEPNLGRMPVGDPAKLRQIFINLISNAIKFTNTGMVKFFVEVKDISENKITMHFEIKDSGIGMSKEQISKIFDAFIQGETGTTRKFGGTGLGLPITKNIIELMGGKLNVESTPGIGSKFFFNITFDTIDISNDEKLVKRYGHKEVVKPVFDGEVLICEDNTMNQQVICEHLSRVGLKYLVAANGKIGVDLVQGRKDHGEKQFDLILMDMNMPIMDGLEATNKIFQIENIPIVAMTANIMHADREIYKRNGLNDCVGKPFTSQELWHCLLKYLTPIKGGVVKIDTSPENELEFQKSLLISFLDSNKNRFSEITNALKENDIVLAHRLAHSLKSNAGQIGKTELQKAALEVELHLVREENKTNEEQLNKLETELNLVLSKIAGDISDSSEENSESGSEDKID